MASRSLIKRSKRVHPGADSQSFQSIDGTITGLGFYSGSKAVVIRFSQFGRSESLYSAVHGALIPFINTFIAEGRAIHIANAIFINDCIIPSQLFIIDLQRKAADIDFIIQKTGSTSLATIQASKPPEALLLKISMAADEGIYVLDGSLKELTLFYLDPDRLPLQDILRLDDVIVLYKPQVSLTSNKSFMLSYGPSTVIFRVPVQKSSVMTQFSQLSQKDNTDGLRGRNSSSSKTIGGTVEEIIHSVEADIWTSTTISVVDRNGRRLKVVASISSCQFESIKILSAVKPMHYFWAIDVQFSASTFFFTKDTIAFDVNLLHGLINSNISPAVPISSSSSYVSFITRAIILDPKCKSVEIHNLCQTVLSKKGVCSVCRSQIISEKSDDLVVTFFLDDGSCEPIKACTLASKLPFWGITAEKWNHSGQGKQNEVLRMLDTKEFMFYLSLANSSEFGGSPDEKVWRVDICSLAIGDVERDIRQLLGWHLAMDRGDDPNIRNDNLLAQFDKM